jgi:hypothetical protein
MGCHRKSTRSIPRNLGKSGLARVFSPKGSGWSANPEPKARVNQAVRRSRARLGRRSPTAGQGAIEASEMKAPRIDPDLGELLGLSLLAGGGAGFALAQGNLLFVGIFGVACGVIAIQLLRGLP